MATDPKWKLYKTAMMKRYLKSFRDCKNIVDIGAYEGEFVRLLQKKGKNAIGIDLHQSNKLVIRGDARKLPFKSEKFDCAVLIHLIEHLQVEDVKKAIREAHRVLRAGGKLFIAVPVNKMWDDASHVRPYTFKAIRQLLELPKYIGENWKFKVIHKETRVRHLPLWRGLFYRLGLFGFYNRFVFPIISLPKIGFKELIVVAEKC